MGRIETIIADMQEEMPFELPEDIKPYIAIAIRIYGNEKVLEAAEVVRDFETLVDTYDCTNPRNEDLALAVIEVLKDEEGQELLSGKKPLVSITESDAIEALIFYHGEKNRYRLSKSLLLSNPEGYLKHKALRDKLEFLNYETKDYVG